MSRPFGKVNHMLLRRLVPDWRLPVIGHKLLRRRHAERRRRHSGVIARPQTCVERNSVHHLLRRDLLERPLDAIFHIVDRRHAAGLGIARIVLVIPHDTDVVRKNSLLVHVVIIIEIIGHIIVDRKGESLLPAADGKLADEFDEVLPVRRIDLLEIDIDSVKTVLIREIHELCDYILPSREKRDAVIVIDARRIEIIDDRPDLPALVMCLRHIIRRCPVSKISVVILYTEPGRCNDIQGLYIRRVRVKICVCITVGEIMPRHIDRSVKTHRCEFRFGHVCDRCVGHGLRIRKHLVFKVSDKSIVRLYL